MLTDAEYNPGFGWFIGFSDVNLPKNDFAYMYGSNGAKLYT